MSHRQKQRALKRLNKKENKKSKQNENRQNKKQQSKRAYNSDSDAETSEHSELDEVELDPQGFTDDNQDWLKPKLNAKHQANNGVDSSEAEEDDSEEDAEEQEDEFDEEGEDEQLEEEEDDEEEEEEEGEEEEDDADDDDLRVQSLNDLSEDEDDLFESDSDDAGGDDGDDDDDLLPIEKKSKKLKLKQEEEAKLAEEEMQESQVDHEVFKFPDENDGDEDAPVTLQVVQQRIKDVTLVLSDFKKHRQATRSRQEYVDLLRKDLCLYYSYNEFLMEKFMQIFPINELMEYLEASEVQRPVTIRTNSLKTRRRDLAAALINRGVNLDPLGKWTKVGLVVYNSSVPLGATPEYLAGHYMIQGKFCSVYFLLPVKYYSNIDDYLFSSQVRAACCL